MAKPISGSAKMRGRGRHHEPLIDVITKQIIDMMLDGLWVTGKSHKQLLEQYPDRCIEQITIYAGNASRFIRICRGSEDEVRDRILTMIELGAQKALDYQKVLFNPASGKFRKFTQPDLRALEAFLRFQAEVHGIVGPARKQGPAESVDVPIDELTKVLGALGYDVTRKNGAAQDEYARAAKGGWDEGEDLSDDDGVEVAHSAD